MAAYRRLGALKWGSQTDPTSPEVPPWAYHADVAGAIATMSTKASALKKGFEADTQKDTVGPSIPLAFVSVSIVWAVFAVYPWVALIFMPECPKHGMAHYPSWLIIPFWLIVVLAVIIEYRIMKSVIVSQLVWRIGPVSMFGFKVGFKVWIALYITLSVVSHADLATNSLFLAKVQKTFWCQAKDAQKWSLESLWTNGVSESFLRNIPFVGRLQFHGVVLLSWLTMFIQVVYAIGMSVPRRIVHQDGSQPSESNPRFEYRMATHIVDQEDNSSLLTLFHGTTASCYSVPFAKVQDHSGALQALADAGRMNTITSLQPGFLQGACKNAFAGDLHKELKRAVVKFLAYRVLEAAVQPNLQATALGLASGVELLNTGASSIDLQMVLSILLSLCTAIMSTCLDTSAVVALYNLVHDAGKRELELENAYISEYAELRAGSEWRYAKPRSATAVFAAAESWDVIGYVSRDTIVRLAPGSLEIVDGYPMAPIEPRGHIQLQVFSLVKQNRNGDRLPVLNNSTKNTRGELRMSKFTMAIFIVLLVFDVLMIIYAAVKLFAVSSWCRYGVWNLTGCADLGA